jgi:hypothetical protein
MRTNFRTGQLHADSDFLSTVPRSAMIKAIVVHATSQPQDGPISTRHDHDGQAFVIETGEDRCSTTIRLA